MISIFFYPLIFIFGLIVGSFLNCVIYRLENKESFLKGRSYCPHCKHKLSLLDLIPVFSFIALKGKCRYCQKKISAQYPLLEIVTGILFVFVFSTIPTILISLTAVSNLRISYLSLIFYWIFICFLIIIFTYDLKHFIIPDKVIYPAIILVFIYQLYKILVIRAWDLIGHWSLVIGIFSPAFLAAGFFLIIFLISRGKWIGFGDIKLGFFMGLLLGWPNIIPALFISFLLGAIIGIGLIIAKKKGLKSEVPFGPFLVTGTFISLFWAEKIINWYLNLFV